MGSVRLVLSRNQLNHGALMPTSNFGFYRATARLTARMDPSNIARSDANGSNADEDPR
jgi:hypothetical protein